MKKRSKLLIKLRKLIMKKKRKNLGIVFMKKVRRKK